MFLSSFTWLASTIMFMSLWACLQSSRVTKVREVPFLLKQINQEKSHKANPASIHSTAERPPCSSVSYLLSLVSRDETNEPLDSQTPCSCPGRLPRQTPEIPVSLHAATEIRAVCVIGRLDCNNNQSNGRYYIALCWYTSLIWNTCISAPISGAFLGGEDVSVRKLQVYM